MNPNSSDNSKAGTYTLAGIAGAIIAFIVALGLGWHPVWPPTSTNPPTSTAKPLPTATATVTKVPVPISTAVPTAVNTIPVPVPTK